MASATFHKIKIDVPASAYEIIEGDSLITRAEVAFFRLVAGSVSRAEISALASDLLGAFPGGRLIQSIELILESAAVDAEMLLTLVRELCSKAHDLNLEIYGDLRVLLKRLLDRRHSELDNSAVAATLQLPELAQLAH